jgi:hypothetical protein
MQPAIIAPPRDDAALAVGLSPPETKSPTYCAMGCGRQTCAAWPREMLASTTWKLPRQLQTIDLFDLRHDASASTRFHPSYRPRARRVALSCAPADG